jgi:hypothetical protein
MTLSGDCVSAAGLTHDSGLTAATVRRMIVDVLAGLGSLALLALLFALALVLLLLSPLLIALLLFARLLYWLASRVPMWVDPDSTGRLHRWPRSVNAAISLGIFAVIGALVWLVGRQLAKLYLGWVFGWLWSFIGWAAPGSLEGRLCTSSGKPDCAVAFHNWLDGPPVQGWLMALILALAGIASIAVYVQVTGSAKRLSELERQASPSSSSPPRSGGEGGAHREAMGG